MCQSEVRMEVAPDNKNTIAGRLLKKHAITTTLYMYTSERDVAKFQFQISSHPQKYIITDPLIYALLMHCEVPLSE